MRPERPMEIEQKLTQIEFYSELYKVHKSDSPDASRSNLLRRAHPYITLLGHREFALELGSGRGVLTHQYLSHRKIDPSYTIVTLDIADIPRKKLLAKKVERVGHVRADGTELPFRDGSFAIVISSLALDFMGEEAIPEVYRVLRPSGVAEINLHHPDLIPDNLDFLLIKGKLSAREKTILKYWVYLRNNHILTSDPGEVELRFTRHGFSVERIVKASDGRDSWWEVSVQKRVTDQPKEASVDSTRVENAWAERFVSDHVNGTNRYTIALNISKI